MLRESARRGALGDRGLQDALIRAALAGGVRSGAFRPESLLLMPALRLLGQAMSTAAFFSPCEQIAFEYLDDAADGRLPLCYLKYLRSSVVEIVRTLAGALRSLSQPLSTRHCASSAACSS